MEERIVLAFAGPFGWLRDRDVPCIFDAEVAQQPGIYLWTVRAPDGDLVYYVGETGRSFAVRMNEHLRDQLAGAYRIFEPSGFAQGRKEIVWRGLVGRDRERSLSDFASRLSELAPVLTSFLPLVRFFVAPIEYETTMRRRIESELADHFYRQEGLVGEFQDQGIYYERSPLPIEPFHVELTWPATILGAPTALVVGSNRAEGDVPNT
jgi:hypothetical protein